MKNNAHKILTFLSVVDENWMLSFFQEASKSFGKELVDQVIETRSKLPNKRFSSLEELYAIKSLGEKGTNTLLSSIKEDKYPEMIKSADTFTFTEEPNIPKSYQGKIAFEETGSKNEKENQRTYLLYYKPELEKETILKLVKSLAGFKSRQRDRLFAIQTMNNRFIAAQAGYLTPQSHYKGYIYNFEIGVTTIFRINHLQTPAYPSLGSTYVQNGNAAVTFEYDDLTNPSRKGILKFDKVSNKILGAHLTQQLHITTDYQFDIEGIIGRPSWASPDKFRSFSIMNHTAQNPQTSNTREFIQQGSIHYQILEGTNSQTPWVGKTNFRYVEVIKDVCIRAIHNNSHQGVQKDNMYLSVNINTNPQVSTEYVAPGTTNIPQNIFLDMYVFYGYWEDRNSISSKIMLAPSGGYNFININSNDQVKINTGSVDIHTQFLFLEQGWGQNNNNVYLKTIHGKYLKSWQNVVVADATAPVVQEQWEIIIP